MRMRCQPRLELCRHAFAASLILAFLIGTMSLAAPPESDPADHPEFSIEPVPGTTAQAPVMPLVLPPPVSTKEPITVEQSLDQAIITVGDLITYTMTVNTPEGLEVALPPPGAQLGQFIIRDYQIPEPEESKGRLVHKFIFNITAYTTGQLEIPPIPLLINPRGESASALITEGIQVRVAPVTDPEDLEIRDVKNPLSIPMDWKPYLIAAAAALSLLGAGAAVLLYLSRWRPRPEALPEPVRPAHELAYQELRDLVKERLLEAGEIEAFYTRLSEIIRRYIALRWRIYALEYTSTEILDALKTRVLTNRVYERIRWFLQETDLVKFALHIPAESARREIIDRAREIVDWSREEEFGPAGEEALNSGRSEEAHEERVSAG
jgi:hypothetical protein